MLSQAFSASDCTENGCVENYPDSCATTGSHEIAVVYSGRTAVSAGPVLSSYYTDLCLITRWSNRILQINLVKMLLPTADR